MNRRRRTKILIDGSRHFARERVHEIESAYTIHVLAEPHHALTMIKMRETAKKTLFTLARCLSLKQRYKSISHSESASL